MPRSYLDREMDSLLQHQPNDAQLSLGSDISVAQEHDPQNRTSKTIEPHLDTKKGSRLRDPL